MTRPYRLHTQFSMGGLAATLLVLGAVARPARGEETPVATSDAAPAVQPSVAGTEAGAPVETLPFRVGDWLILRFFDDPPTVSCGYSTRVAATHFEPPTRDVLDLSPSAGEEDDDPPDRLVELRLTVPCVADPRGGVIPGPPAVEALPRVGGPMPIARSVAPEPSRQPENASTTAPLPCVAALATLSSPRLELPLQKRKEGEGLKAEEIAAPIGAVLGAAAGVGLTFADPRLVAGPVIPALVGLGGASLGAWLAVFAVAGPTAAWGAAVAVPVGLVGGALVGGMVGGGVGGIVGGVSGFISSLAIGNEYGFGLLPSRVGLLSAAGQVGIFWAVGGAAIGMGAGVLLGAPAGMIAAPAYGATLFE